MQQVHFAASLLPPCPCPLARYYDIDSDPFQLHNLAQDATINTTVAFVARMAALASRLRLHMACEGAGCFDPPPTPPVPPPPTPGTGSVHFAVTAAGNTSAPQCLTLAPPTVTAVGGTSALLTLGPCASAAAWLCDSDDKGNPEISTNVPSRNNTIGASGARCLNVLDLDCKTGGIVHVGPCQNDTAKLRRGNHFHWSGGVSGGQVISDTCKGMCVQALVGGASLVRCDAATENWTRQPLL